MCAIGAHGRATQNLHRKPTLIQSAQAVATDVVVYHFDLQGDRPHGEMKRLSEYIGSIVILKNI
jgi:hypothetical protein